ncbi:MAG: hypothetical protein H7A36_04545 [Chlamydiales bacterium]|nr:hypothetical protein [Chlamydiales bacterium]
MITIEMSTALMIYLALMLGICFTIWLLSHKKARKKVALPAREQLMRCEYCHFSYLAEEKVSKCPQCSQFNSPSK